MLDPRTADELRAIKRELASLRAEVSGTAVHIGVATGGGDGRIIYAQVNEASGVASGDPTFSFDNARKVVGVVPTGGTGTAQNQYAQSYANDEWVFLLYDVASGNWLTERGGSTSGSQVVFFELIEDKGYADASPLAKPVDAAGAIISAAPSVYLIDQELRYYGLAAAGGEYGYRFHGVRITDDFLEGVPGYRIIDGEGPADVILVTLYTAVSGASATCSLFIPPEVGGGPDAARLPRLDGSAHMTVYDDLDVAATAQVGDDWWAKWDRTAERYIFWEPVEPPPTGSQYGLLITTLPAATIPGSGTWEITPGTADAAIVMLEWNSPPTKLVAQMSGETAVTKRGIWRGATPLRGSSTEPIGVIGRLIQFDAGAGEVEVFWVDSEWDARGGVAYVKANSQAFQHGAASTPAWEDDEVCA